MAERQPRFISEILVSVLLSTIPTALGADENQRPGWQQLDLVKTSLADTTVYYEEVLEPNLPILEWQLREFQAERQRILDFVEKRRLVVADINRILGAPDANNSWQEKIFTDMAGMFLRTRFTFHMARASTIKDYLRAGGQLPNFTYDPQSDVLQYLPEWSIEPGQEPPEERDVFVPGTPAGGSARHLLVMLTGRATMFMAIHEVVEMTLFERADHIHAHWRWFTDGCANAITQPLVEKYLGRGAAEEFAAGYDTKRHAELENAINLRYWLVGNFSPYVSQIPVESEKRILDARYAYATFEVKRLIDSNGIDCVRRILDRVAAKGSHARENLAAVIEEVTGQDVEARLDRYQAFKTKEEGIQLYVAAFGAAQKSLDYERMFVNLMRVIELQGDHPSRSNLRNFTMAAVMLWKIGHEKAADCAMDNGVRIYSQEHIPGGRKAALEAFASYALATNRPQNAEQIAEQLLQTDPKNAPSLTVKMVLSKNAGRLAEARALARQVQRFAKPGSDFYRNATKLLAADPSDPNTHEPVP